MKKIAILLFSVLILCSCSAPKPSSQSQAIIDEELEVEQEVKPEIQDNLEPELEVEEEAEIDTEPESIHEAEVKSQAEAKTETKAKPVSKPNTPISKPSQEEVVSQNNLVTISIADLDSVILEAVAIELEDGESVFDILKKITREKKIHMEFSGRGTSSYVKGINNLYEFDMGPESGWLYKVNGLTPGVSAGNYQLEAGDLVEWVYTIDSDQGQG